MGHLKKDLSPDDKEELLALIEDYRQELVPLIVPLTPSLCSTTCAGMRCPTGCGSSCICGRIRRS